ncbi:MAG TPA: Ig-like domain-containing protein [Bacteroidales bacterium]|nr:Ig-like domain-containing protein [Bacteroidales bacterium]
MKYVSFSTLAAIVLMFLVSLNSSGQQTIKIMGLGDSMIEGWMDGDENKDGSTETVQDSAKRKGFRYELKQLLEQAGYSIDYVGSKRTGFYYFSDCQNAGISGTRDQYLERMLIDGWDERWSKWEVNHRPYLDVFKPDIILLNVGTNDITHEDGIKEPDAIINQRVSAILDQIDQYEIRSGKNVPVFLALIINRRMLIGGGYPDNYYYTHQWNLAIKNMAQQRISNGDNIVIVNLEEEAGINYGYSAGDMCITDPQGLHPSEAGYNKMANLWYQKFMQNYNQAPVIAHIPNLSASEGTNFSTLSLDNYVSDVEDADQYITWTYTQVGTSNLNISVTNRVLSVSAKNGNWNGSQTVIFKATDRGHNLAAAKYDLDTVVFTVTPFNDPPVITAQTSLTTIEDTPITLKLSDFTISDPDSDPSTFQLVINSGNHYTFSGTRITPELNYNGQLTVNVSVKDATDTGPVFNALINVTAVNDPPAFISQPEISINEDNNYTVDLHILSINDPDDNVDNLSLVLLPGLNYSIENENTISPDSNYYGDLFIESYLQDPQDAASQVFYLHIIVNPVNDDPVFTTEPMDSAIVSKQYIYAFLATDPDQENLTYSVPVKPDWMTFYPNSKLIAGIPPANAKYLNNIAIGVSDGHKTVLQTYILRIKGVIDPVSETSEDKLTVFPNPASDHIEIQGHSLTDETLFLLYSMDGNLIMQEQLSKGNSILYFKKELTPGIYFYSIRNKITVSTGKLLIE